LGKFQIKNSYRKRGRQSKKYNKYGTKGKWGGKREKKKKRYSKLIKNSGIFFKNLRRKKEKNIITEQSEEKKKGVKASRTCQNMSTKFRI